MHGTAPGIVGTGYEGVDLDAFLARLGEQRINVLVDVRLTPISRKRGFSKTALSTAVTSAGAGYLHLRGLGNPKTNRAGFGGSLQELSEARDRYSALLTDEAAETALDQLVELAKHQRVAVMCFEADEQRCHRDVVLHQVRLRLERDLVEV
ncbi:DUF488 family protein [Lentzea sp. JNUCC 0626]|uniref:DUF488 domain-containing protein n=1 Tax=Lentzea sp. JNUCC 0626 TaxID=3367513 RepID=UPI0037482DCB